MNVKEIAIGFLQTFFLKNDGSLYCMGHNNYGQCGYGTTTPSNSPVPVSLENNYDVSRVRAGMHYSLLIQNGTVMTFGLNNYGQLGVNDNDNRLIPTKIFGNYVAKEVSGIDFHSMILGVDGKVRAFGRNDYGQLGDGTTVASRIIPVEVAVENFDIKKIAAGRYHSMFLKEDGRVFSYGLNNLGQLGDGTYNAKSNPALIPTQNTRIIDICAGIQHSMFLKSTGKVYAFGAGNVRRLYLINILGGIYWIWRN